jgi:hypothetical protein
MSMPAVIENLRSHPEMYFSPVSIDNIVVYLQGCDVALHGGLLVGLGEWLVLQTGYGANLAWSGLLDELLVNGSSKRDDQAVIDRLFGLLDEYFAMRSNPAGLRRTLVEYEMWLRRQEWYTPGSPGWFPLASPSRSRRPKNATRSKTKRRSRSK